MLSLSKYCVELIFNFKLGFTRRYVASLYCSKLFIVIDGINILWIWDQLILKHFIQLFLIIFFFTNEFALSAFIISSLKITQFPKYQKVFYIFDGKYAYALKN